MLNPCIFANGGWAANAGVRCAVSVSKEKKIYDETKDQGAKHDNGPKPKSHKGTWPSWPWISGLVLSMFEIAGNRSLLERNAATLHSGYWISIYSRYSFVDIFRRLQVCVCDVCVCVLYHVDVLQVSVSTVHRSISTSSMKCKKMSCNWL